MPDRSYFRLRSVCRLALLGIALPLVYVGGAALGHIYHHRALSRTRDLFHLAPALAPTSATRLMVFAPHCDDETLGCGGLIQRTLANGGAAQAVLFTNGDGFRTAVERQMRDLRVGPDDYIRFAALRQNETDHALAHLGLKPADILFLGYPDGGTLALWNANWNPDSLYRSRYTRCDRSPYANTYDPKARYCGADALRDVKNALRAFRPNLVTVTHPAEDHPDHAAAAAFVARAIQELQADPTDRAWASKIQLRYYLIHRGDWPLPQGEHPDEPLLPPSEMAHTDTHWTTFALTPQETARKAEAIRLYPSQTEIMARFLASFARSSELYGEIPTLPLPTVPDNTMRADADPQDWEARTPILLDPLRDSVLRDLHGGGDIAALYACRDSQHLYLRLDTRQPMSRYIAYTLRLRPFSASDATPGASYTLTVHIADAGRALPDGSRIAVRDRTLEISLPWARLTEMLPGSEPLSALALSAETTLAGGEVDKTGVRIVQIAATRR